MIAVDTAIAALATAGLDIAQRFDARALAAELAIPALACASLGVLVGNTRALWPALVRARRGDAALRASLDPVEHHVEAAVAHAFAAVMPARVVFSHRRYDGAFLPFQRVAVASGLASSAPTGLVIHAEYGPWFALRAIVVCDGEPPTRRAAPVACCCDAACATALAQACERGGWRAWVAVRDACTAGRAWRYSDAQIAYHYAHDMRALDDE